MRFFAVEEKAQVESKTSVAAGALTVYRVDAPFDQTRLDSFPVLDGESKGWSVRTWQRSLSASETAALLELLDNERGKYGSEGLEGQARARIDVIRSRLSQQPLDSALVGVLYKRNPPGSKEYHYGDWLYVYFADARTRTVVEISNAFR